MLLEFHLLFRLLFVRFALVACPVYALNISLDKDDNDTALAVQTEVLQLDNKTVNALNTMETFKFGHGDFFYVGGLNTNLGVVFDVQQEMSYFLDNACYDLDAETNMRQRMYTSYHDNKRFMLSTSSQGQPIFTMGLIRNHLNDAGDMLAGRRADDMFCRMRFVPPGVVAYGEALMVISFEAATQTAIQTSRGTLNAFIFEDPLPTRCVLMAIQRFSFYVNHQGIGARVFSAANPYSDAGGGVRLRIGCQGAPNLTYEDILSVLQGLERYFRAQRSSGWHGMSARLTRPAGNLTFVLSESTPVNPYGVGDGNSTVDAALASNVTLSVLEVGNDTLTTS